MWKWIREPEEFDNSIMMQVSGMTLGALIRRQCLR